MIAQELSYISALSIKILIMVGIMVYGIFAVLIVRQVDLMARTFSTHYQSLLKLLSIIHLTLVLIMAVIAIVWI